ncbi:MAG: glycosyltransferase family 4 protein [Clostridiales bacterium]|nr:glycosyltransferase family 4 protein [Clostridiales bacterium]
MCDSKADKPDKDIQGMGDSETEKPNKKIVDMGIYEVEKPDKKILILANSDGGLYRFRGMLIEALLKLGYEIHISVPDGECIPLFTDMGCRFIDTPVDRRGLNPKTDMALLRMYVGIVSRVEPDLVITYTIKPNIYGGIVCRRRGIPCAANITGMGAVFQKRGPLRAFVTLLYRAALKNAKVVFFENGEDRKTFERRGICTGEQSHVLHGAGVDLAYFQYAAYPADDGPVHFLFAGRVMKEKGMDEMFEAMRRLRASGEDCVLDVLGDYEEDYSSAIRQHERDGWLNYYGYQKDVRPFIRRAHCFVLPSWHEGMANVNLECAASGRPVITSDIPGCREAVVDGVSGLLCESKNADSLYAAMKRFLGLSRGEKEAMGKAGRRHAEAEFDKRKVVEETLGCLSERTERSDIE